MFIVNEVLGLEMSLKVKMSCRKFVTVGSMVGSCEKYSYQSRVPADTFAYKKLKLPLVYVIPRKKKRNVFLHKVCPRNYFKYPYMAEWDSKVIIKKTLYFGLSSLFVEKSHQKTPEIRQV